MSEKEMLVASKRRNDLLKFIGSNTYKDVVGKIEEKVKNRRLITENSDDEKKIFRAQGAIEALKYVLTIPEKLENEIGS